MKKAILPNIPHTCCIVLFNLTLVNASFIFQVLVLLAALCMVGLASNEIGMLTYLYATYLPCYIFFIYLPFNILPSQFPLKQLQYMFKHYIHLFYPSCIIIILTMTFIFMEPQKIQK